MGMVVHSEFYMCNTMEVIHHERGTINHIDVIPRTWKPYKHMPSP
jgi:hypothetical protein